MLNCVLGFMTIALIGFAQPLLNAQEAADPTSALALPVAARMECAMAEHELMKDLPARATGLEFRIGTPIGGPILMWPREILVVFDTIGSPVILMDETTRYTARGIPAGSVTVMAVFPVPGQPRIAKHMSIAVDTVKLSQAMDETDLEKSLATASKPVSRDLNSDELEKVKALGAWLWERRCLK